MCARDVSSCPTEHKGAHTSADARSAERRGRVLLLKLKPGRNGGHPTAPEGRKLPHRKTGARVVGAIALLATVAEVVAGCGSSPNSASASSANGKATIRVAVVSNSNMVDIEKLTPEFEKLYPNIHVVYDTLNENNERSLIETDITTHANQFNAVMISNYETPIWAKNGWLVNLTPALTADKSYDINDLIKPIRNALTYNGGL